MIKRSLKGYKFCIFNHQGVIVDDSNIFDRLSEDEKKIQQGISGDFYFLRIDENTFLCFYYKFSQDQSDLTYNLSTDQELDLFSDACQTNSVFKDFSNFKPIKLSESKSDLMIFIKNYISWFEIFFGSKLTPELIENLKIR